MSAPDSEALTPDEVFEILSNHRRRMVLYYLRTHGDSAGVKELAEEIAAMENDVPVEELTSQQRKRVYVSLYQTHLPKMAQMNAIEYDKDAGTVRLTNQTNDIDQYLTTDQEPTYPWTMHYFVLTVVGATTVVLSLLDVPVFDAVQPLWLALGTLVLLVASAGAQVWYDRTRSEEIPFELRRDDR